MVSCRELRRNKGNIIGSFGAEAVCRGYVNASLDARTKWICRVWVRKLCGIATLPSIWRWCLPALWHLRPVAARETLQRGYVLPEGGLEQVPVGATQEQVLIVLGTPSTVATVNGEAFYYISQKASRSVAFLPHEVVDQRVIAVYFDKERRVSRLANYGVKDGKVFDFYSQTTPTGGQELSYLRNIFKNVGFHL